MAPVPKFWKRPFLDMASSVWAMPREEWIDDSPNLQDTDLLKKEAMEGSSIDDINMRGEMIEKWKRKEVSLRVKELPERTRIVFLGTDDQWSKIPWAFWARIFQAMGYPVGRVLFYAHPSLREYPEKGGQIGSKHINAGYSYICQQNIVVIYRFEEATRVLLHELLHTACFDKEKHVTALEANTEAWTEVLLCALLSRGKENVFNALWLKQCKWIHQQSLYLQSHWNVLSEKDYAWRYTIGKHQVLKSLGYMNTSYTSSEPIVTGLRFTTPELDSFMVKN